MVHTTFQLCLNLPSDPSYLHPNKLTPCLATSQWEPLLGINKAQRKLFKSWKGKVKQNYAVWGLWRRLWVWWDKELMFCSVGGREDLALWECELSTFLFHSHQPMLRHLAVGRSLLPAVKILNTEDPVRLCWGLCPIYYLWEVYRRGAIKTVISQCVGAWSRENCKHTTGSFILYSFLPSGLDIL